MTTAMILESIALWNANIADSEKLVHFLSKGNCFTYDNISYPDPSDYIHVYPGVYDDKLYFFVIPEAYDKPEYASTISDYVQACPAMWALVGSHTIPDIEAEIRIIRWKNEYETWVPTQVADPVGMFKAFQVPGDDFEGDECLATLGLQIGGVEGLKTADLIIANADSKELIQFDDYTEPVPPFSASAAIESFYLLEASAEIN